MKAIRKTLIITSALVFSLAAQAEKFEAQLTEFHGDQRVGLESTHAGQVIVDDDKITLQLDTAYPCPTGRMCVQMLRRVDVDLPRKAGIEYDRVGNKHYRAVEDRRAVDGTFAQIEVIDYSQRLMAMAERLAVMDPMIQPVDETALPTPRFFTQVIYSVVGPRSSDVIRSTFFGDELQNR